MDIHPQNIDSIREIQEHVLIPGTSHEGMWLGPYMIFTPGTPARDIHMIFSATDRSGGDSVQVNKRFVSQEAPKDPKGFSHWHTVLQPEEYPTQLQPETDADGFCFMPSFLNWKYHPAMGKVVGFGSVLRHKGPELSNHLEHLAISYSVYDPADRTFTPWKSFRVTTDGVERPCAAYGQRVDLPGGDILLPFSTVKEIHGWDTIYWSGSIRCRFNGDSIEVVEVGNLVSQPKLRGFVEPSMAECNGTYSMTLRANDGHSYLTTSQDGLHWQKPSPWIWDDGTSIAMNQTMSKFIRNDHGLFFVYTRITGDNENVVRHRAPLFIGQIDPEKGCLLRETESVLMANRGFPLGNFNVYQISPTETWVTAPEWDRSGEDIPCDNRLTRILWE